MLLRGRRPRRAMTAVAIAIVAGVAVVHERPGGLFRHSCVRIRGGGGG